MQFAHDVAAAIGPYVARYGVLAIFVIIYFESFGIPLPGESALIAASLLASHGELAVVPLLLAAWSGAVLGDSTGYLIGHVGGRRLLQRYGWVARLTPERLAWIEGLFRRRGALIVFGARFVVVLRQLNGLVAGSMAMPWPRFLAANALGAAAWTGLWVLGPFWFADLFAWSGIGKRL